MHDPEYGWRLFRQLINNPSEPARILLTPRLVVAYLARAEKITAVGTLVPDSRTAFVRLAQRAEGLRCC
jgi:hypothetical protein